MALKKTARQKTGGAGGIFAQVKKRVLKKTRPGAPAFTRAEKNPIISPRPQNGWEAWQTFNPGAVLLDERVHFLYRAIGEDGLSRFGYASSADGFVVDERLPYPVYEHRLPRSVFSYYSFASGGSFGGAEDPRIVRVNGEERLYMTYTACDGGLGVALSSLSVRDFRGKRWNWRAPRLISPPGETHKNWVLFPEKIRGRYAILHSVTPEVSIAYRDTLEFREGEYIHSRYDGSKRRKNCWDTFVRGAGAPPVKTAAGWLLFYHAIDEKDPGKYKVGVLLLDLNNPELVLRRSGQPVLEPKRDYERSGFKGGVVYVSGAVVKGGELLVYYGASDSFVSVAHAPLYEFVDGLLHEAAPKLAAKTLKKR